MSIANSFIVSCSSCNKRYKVSPDRLPVGISSFNCRHCGSLVFLTSPEEIMQPDEGSKVVLLVTDEPDLSQLIVKILRRGGLKSRIAESGEEALAQIAGQKTDAVLVAVSLRDMMSYEFIDRMRKIPGGEEIPSILLSSMYRGTRYKRMPTTFYGADDYIERHHIPDLIVPKIMRFLQHGRKADRLKASSDQVPSATDEQVDDRRELDRIETQIAESQQKPKSAEEAETEVVSRMARVIVGDIALYNEEAICGHSLQEVKESLSRDLEEGQRLLREKFPGFGGDPVGILERELLRLLQSKGIVSASGEESDES